MTSATPQEQAPAPKIVYWHRELPPLSAQPLGEHSLEAQSERVPYHHAEHDAMWASCHAHLMAATQDRLVQEVNRLGGSCAHVIDEDIRPIVDHEKGEYYLKGAFNYILYTG